MEELEIKKLIIFELLLFLTFCLFFIFILIW